MAFPGKNLVYAPGRTGAHYVQMIKVGFSPSQAAYLLQNATYANPHSRQHGFSKTQANALRAGSFTMASLLKAKFTRPQAVVLRRARGL